MARHLAALAALVVSFTVHAADAMPAGGAGHVAALLPDRSVLVLGGYGADGAPSAAAVLYGADGVPLDVGPMTAARAYHTANQVRSGAVVVIGGEGANGPLPSIELFELAAPGQAGGSFRPSQASLAVARTGHEAFTLADGRVLVTGGSDAAGSPVTAAEVYDPATDSVSPADPTLEYAAVFTDKPDYFPGETVYVTGGRWQPGESVDLVFDADPMTTAVRVVTVTVDSNGQLRGPSGEWLPGLVVDASDFQKSFTLHAVGATSAISATSYFTDAQPPKIKSITPTQGSVDGNTPVTICATGIGATAAVTFGGAAGTVQSVQTGGCGSSDKINVTTPGHSLGRVDVVVTYGGQSDKVVNGFTFLGRSQTITFGSLSNQTYGAAFTVSATATSGLAVTFSASGPCTASGQNGTTITTTGAGRCIVTASQAGDGTLWAAALDVQQPFDIAARTITATLSVGNKVYDASTAATATCAVPPEVLVGSDAVNCAVQRASFSDKNVGAGKTVTATVKLSGNDADKYQLSSAQVTATADITPASATASITAASKTYDGTTSATVTGCSPSGVLLGDTVTCTATARFDTKNVGTAKTVTATGITFDGADGGNYKPSGAAVTTTADITALAISATITAASKVYDGTTSATVTACTPSGVVLGDTVTCSATAAFDTKGAGTGKTVTATGITFGGPDGGNYKGSGAAVTATADVAPLAITATITAAGKVYDGTTSATVTGCSPSGVLAGDTVTCTATARFDTKNVGTAKTVTATGITFDGGDGGNYKPSGAAVTTTADITALAISATITAASKVYDGTTSATVTACSPSGVLLGDSVTCTATAAFDTKSAGTGKTVTAAGLAFGGPDGGNYKGSGAAVTATADIAPLAITATISAASKVYDRSTSATVTACTPSGVLLGDTVTCTATAAFDTKNVGIGKTVTAAGLAFGGTDGASYKRSGAAVTTTADIAPLAITASFTAASKVYDGTTSATVTACTPSGVLLGDTVTCSATAAFDTKSAGTGKTVTAAGIAFAGPDGGNYKGSGAAVTATADIAPLAITATIIAADKVYDRSTSATVTACTPSGVLLGDTVACTAAAAFDTKDVGIGKTVTATGLAFGGPDGGNYERSAAAVTTLASITPAPVTASVSAANKILDGSALATVTGCALAGVIAPDVVTCGAAAGAFDSAIVGAGKTVTATGITLAGADASNYQLTSTSATTTASILYAPAGLACAGDSGHSILQPIDAGGTSVWKSRSTVPAKFRVCDAKGNSIGTAGVVSGFYRLASVSGTTGDVNELSVSSATPDTAFRWDPNARQWIFNISTSALTGGGTYAFLIHLNDGTDISFQFGLR